MKCIHKINEHLTENAFRNTRHCMMPSIVSPVKQNVPVRWRPLRPITEQRLAWTKAFCDRVAAVKAGWCDPELINRSSESISPLRNSVYRVPLFKTQCSSQRAILSLKLQVFNEKTLYPMIVLLLTCNMYTQNCIYNVDTVWYNNSNVGESICHFSGKKK